MSIRRSHKNASKSRSRLARIQHKATKLREKARASTIAMMERRSSQLSWWQRTFRVPLVGFYGWVRSRCATLWSAFMTILGWKPSDKKLAPRHGELKKSAKKAATRQLIHESMEKRQLLASDVGVIATDTFAEEDTDPVAQQGQFTITLDSAATGAGAKIEYELTGEANSEFGTDYDAITSSGKIGATGFITIPAGQTQAVVDIDVIDDDLYDGDANEDVVFTILSATDDGKAITIAKTGGKASDSLEIQDDDAAPSISITASDASAAEPADNGKFTVSMSGKSDTDTEVALGVSGSAISGADFTKLPASAKISAGDTSADVDVTVIDDTIIEGDETVTATLGAVTGNKGITASGSDTVTIADTDDSEVVDIVVTGPGSVAEPAGSSFFNVGFQGGGQSSTETVIKYSVSGDATEDVDYTLGITNEVEINDDAAGPQAGVGAQGLGGFSLAPNADIANATTVPHVSIVSTKATNTAVNDDVYAFYTSTGGAATFDIDATAGIDTYIEVLDSDGVTVLGSNDDSGSVDSGSASKSDSSLAVNLPSAGVYYLRVTDTTKAGVPVDAEYTAHLSVPGAQNHVVIGSGGLVTGGETPIGLTVINDSIVEETEPVKITLDSIVQGDPQIKLSGTAADLEKEIDITDDDKATVSIAGTQDATEPSTNGQFTFTLSDPASTDTKLKWTLDDANSTTLSATTVTGKGVDPAEKADHGLADSGFVTIMKGQTQVTLTVPVIDSDLIEEDETLTIDFTIDDADPEISTGATEAKIKFFDEDTATVDVDATVTTAIEGGTDGVFSFILSKPPGFPTGDPAIADRPTVVTYEIGGTATATDDYTPLDATATGTVTIPAYASSANVLVDAKADLKLEGVETVTVKILTLEAPTDSNITQGAGSQFDEVKIIDGVDDALTVKIEGGPNAIEGGTDGKFTFEIVGAAATTSDVKVDYSFVAGSSSADVALDTKAAASGTVTIPAGTTQTSITIEAIDDGLFEGDETFTVQIDKVSGGALGGGTGVTKDAMDEDTILIEDAQSGTYDIIDPMDAAESGVDGEFTIKLGGFSDVPTVVTYKLTPDATDPATNGVDFEPIGGKYQTAPDNSLTGTITLDPFVDSFTVPVEVINDGISEPTESFKVEIVDVISGLTYTAGKTPDATIQVFSDQTVRVEATTKSTSEGSGTPAEFTFFLELEDGGDPATSDQDTTVYFDILTGNPDDATEGSDYKLSTSAVITKGSTSVTVPVAALDDSLLEGTETVRIQLTKVDGETDVDLIGKAGDPAREAEVTIDDNDLAYLTIKATKTPGEDNFGSDVDAEFTVYISQPVDVDTVVTFTVDGSSTATPDDDYDKLSGEVTILEGKSSAVIPVDVFDDMDIEGLETVKVNLEGVEAPGGKTHPYEDRIFLGALGTKSTTPGEALLEFQQGADLGFSFPLPGPAPEYKGAADAFIDQQDSAINFSIGDVEIDTDTFPGPSTAAEHGLIKFSDIVGSGFGLIPADSPILDAELILSSFDTGPVFFHQLLEDWDDSSITWNSAALGANIQPGIQADDVEAASAGQAIGLGFGTQGTSVPSTSLVQEWIDGTSDNFGWAVLPGGKLISASFEGSEDGTQAQRPLLAVTLDVSATIEIVDNDSATVNVVSTSLAQETGSANGSIVVQLQDGNGDAVSSTSPTTVYFDDTTLLGTPGWATPGSDYKNFPASVTIPANATEATIVLDPNNDGLIEGFEKVSVKLTKVDSADPEISLGTKVDGVTGIEDDDFGLVTITANDPAGKEGDNDAEFTVTMSSPSATDTVVKIDISGEAGNGTDYKAISNLVTIPANQKSVTIPIEVIDDDINETKFEDVIIKLDSITAGNKSAIVVSSPSSDTALIEDNETPLKATVVATKDTAYEQKAGVSVDGEFQIQLNHKSDQDTEIWYSISSAAELWNGTGGPDFDGSALPGVDKFSNGAMSVTGSIIIKAGDTSATFPVDVFNDFDNTEGPEAITLSITKAENVNGDPASGSSDVVTIVDPVIEVSVEKTDSPAAEPGPAAGSNGQFTFTITEPVPSDTVVTYKISGDALPASTPDPITKLGDYEDLSGTVTILANQTQATVDVKVIDDSLVEGDETVIVEITGASSKAVTGTVTYDPTAATEVIMDDDAATVSVTGFDGTEGGDDGKFVFTLTNPASTHTYIEYKVDAGNTDATATDDYDPTDFTGTETVKIPAGATSVVVTVPIVNDSLVEPTETLTIDIVDVTGTDPQVTKGSPDTAGVDIIDNGNGAKISLLATDANGFEPGTNDGKFTLFASNPSSTPTVITFEIAAGTDAMMGDDYLLRDGTITGKTVVNMITLPANATSHAIVVDVLDDDLIEDLEYVKVALVKTDNPAITVDTAVQTVTISDPLTPADNDYGLVSIEGTTDGEEDGKVSGVFTVTLDALSDEDTTISYDITGGDAVAADHGLTKGTVTIKAMTTQTTITVPIVDDNIAELTEKLEVSLTGITAGHTDNISVDAGNKTDTIDIIDDDSSVLTVSSPSIAEGNPGDDQRLKFVITNPNTVTGKFDVDWSISLDTAEAGDITGPTSGTVTFSGAAGQTQVVEIPIVEDLTVEADETLKLTLDKATIASPIVVVGAEGVGTIENDDKATFSIVDIAPIGEGTDGSPSDGPFTELKLKIELDNPIDVDTTVDIDFSNLTAVGGDFDVNWDAKAGKYTLPVTVAGFDFDNDASESDQKIAPGTVSHLQFSANNTVSDERAANISSKLGDYDFIVRIVQDDIVEGGTDAKTAPGSETFDVSITATPDEPRLIDDSDTETAEIIDDDSATISIKATDPLASEPFDTVDEGNGEFTITQTAVSSSDSVLTYTVSGSADGSDYKLVGTATIPAGSTQTTITVEVLDSPELEDDETVTLTLTGFTSHDPNVTLSKDVSDTVTILDDDQATVTVVATDAAASEDPLDDGEFTLTLSEVSDTNTIVYYQMMDSAKAGDGLATNGDDYATLDGTATISAGQTQTTISVDVLPDVEVEDAEDVVLKLLGTFGPGTNADISTGSPDEATVVIADDNDGILVNVFNNGDGTENTPADMPGSFIFTITKSDGVTPVAAPAGGLTVQYSSVGGTATQGPAGDYVGLPGSIFIPAGQTSFIHDFVVVDDATPEPTETVILTIQNIIHDPFPGGEPADFTVNQAATVNILDNDGFTPPEVSAIFVDSDDDGIADSQRSSVKQLTINFDLPVDIAADAFTVEKRSDTVVGDVDGTIAETDGIIVNIVSPTQVKLTFDESVANNPLIDAATDSLIDGNFQVIIDASKVNYVGFPGELLDGNGDGTGGDDFIWGDTVTDDFYRMLGDFDGDAIVFDADYLGTFLPAYGTASGDLGFDPLADLDEDGIVFDADFLLFLGNYGTGRNTGGF